MHMIYFTIIQRKNPIGSEKHYMLFLGQEGWGRAGILGLFLLANPLFHVWSLDVDHTARHSTLGMCPSYQSFPRGHKLPALGPNQFAVEFCLDSTVIVFKIWNGSENANTHTYTYICTYIQIQRDKIHIKSTGNCWVKEVDRWYASMCYSILLTCMFEIFTQKFGKTNFEVLLKERALSSSPQSPPFPIVTFSQSPRFQYLHSLETFEFETCGSVCSSWLLLDLSVACM